jgi:hypothetical protein
VGGFPHHSWRCVLPLPEAGRISGDLGPLRNGAFPKPGTIRHLGGGVVEGDAASMGSLLAHTDDYRMEYEGDGLVIVVGKDRWPVEELPG